MRECKRVIEIGMQLLLIRDPRLDFLPSPSDDYMPIFLLLITCQATILNDLEHLLRISEPKKVAIKNLL